MMDCRDFVLDFIVGGLIVAVAVLVGTLVSPLLGGIIAGAPLRLAASIFLAGWHEGDKLAYEMAKGSLLGIAGAMFFAVALVYSIPRVGLIKSFGLATLVWVVATLSLYGVGKVLLK
jgi:uncharacterized membrane protein (GlpM family)